MSLTSAPVNRELRILGIEAKDKVGRHLREIGIAVGGGIVLRRNMGTGVIVEVKEGRLCLDGKLAEQIIVDLEGGEHGQVAQ